ncbi:hypothetical protein PAESOLCIP111_02421 [Paenibacillus solanacearum]|uniref:Uncharacterized protein n=1 Tax=Paenibacillus solanacearum TaxID=2048548 RepID=A0A916K0L6_9BACL|nr:hypothetical protein [Paenibacillus solanacearum]CAG7622389.1 hypothetical protein PAESOLCIP111_02421 [Paenibacillus solanacearum]
MIPGMELIEKLSSEEKSDILAYLLSFYALDDLCGQWAISRATYYRYIKHWGVSLQEIQRKKKRLANKTKTPIPLSHRAGMPSDSLYEKLLDMMRRTNTYSHAAGLIHSWSLNARGSYSLISLLESIHESLEMKQGMYRIAIELTEISAPRQSQTAQASTSAYWMSTYAYPSDLQSIRSFDAYGLHASMNEDNQLLSGKSQQICST